MRFEGNQNNNEVGHTAELARSFRELSPESDDFHAFEALEADLERAGFEVADSNSVSEILHDNSLFCRNESFSRAIDLISENETISIVNKNGAANSCMMASTEGYRTAMLEGFSGKDVNFAVKVVLSFSADNLESHNPIATDNELWQTKPKTAAVSVASQGEIRSEDLRMVSFRFPIHLYPEHLLSDSEKEFLEDEQIKFVVRHYIPKKTAH